MPAAANGRFPAANQIVFSPMNPDVVMARTTFALLPSTDDGATWQYLCESTLGLPSTTYEDPELGLTASGALVAGLSAPTQGLDVSSDFGCSWTCLGGALANQQIADTVVRPDSPHQVLALTGTFVDGGVSSQIYQSVDDGAHWTALGTPIDPAVVVETIDVAANDPMRIYVSGTRGYAASRTASLFVSTDAGQTWTERMIPQFLGDRPGGETSVYIGAVDPTDADRVYIRSSGSADGGESRLYVTTDAGMTFTIAKDFAVEAAGLAIIGELLGFALSPDGSEIYVGTKESGLWRAARSDMSFSLVNATVGVQCLATRQTASGPELWACGNEYSGPPGSPGNFIVGRSTDDGMTFKALLPTLTSLSGVAQCSAAPSGAYACGTTTNAASACSCDDYTNFCTITEVENACLGCGQTGIAGDDGGAGSDAATPSDAGSGGGADATTDGAASKVATKTSSCGCTVVGSSGNEGLFAGLGLFLGAFARRKRR
jgi:MYXO-CTERM domain-containing protein